MGLGLGLGLELGLDAIGRLVQRGKGGRLGAEARGGGGGGGAAPRFAPRFAPRKTRGSMVGGGTRDVPDLPHLLGHGRAPPRRRLLLRLLLELPRERLVVPEAASRYLARVRIGVRARARTKSYGGFRWALGLELGLGLRAWGWRPPRDLQSQRNGSRRSARSPAGRRIAAAARAALPPPPPRRGTQPPE